jgi:lysophospholipase L1-like esterase
MRLRIFLIATILYILQVPRTYAEIPHTADTQSRPVLFIGDSLLHGGAADSSAKNWATTSVPDEFCKLTGYICTNRASNGQSTKNIAESFEENILQTQPWLIIANGGINNIATANDKESFLTDWKSILDTAKRYDTHIIVILVMPWTNGTYNKQLQREDYNKALRQLVDTYDNAMSIDVSTQVGQNRPGGKTGNLWDIQKRFQVDGTHFTNAGYHQIAKVLADAIIIQPKPHIGNIQKLIKNNTIVLRWKTNQESYGKVTYGNDEKSTVMLDMSLNATKDHSVTIQNLKSCSPYHIKIIAKINIFSDSSETTSEDIETSGCAPFNVLYANSLIKTNSFVL